MVPLVRGWIQGMPKRFGSVHLSEVARAGRAGPRLAAGGAFAATLSAADRRLVEARIRLTEPSPEPPVLCTVPLVHTRVFPSWDPADSPLTELVASRVTDVEYSPVWTGEAELDCAPDFLADPDLAALAPVSVGRGYVFGYGERCSAGRG